MSISSPFFFGTSEKLISRKTARHIEKICREEEVEFSEFNVTEGDAPGINGGRYQSWMACQNYGEPFNSDTAQRVLGRISREVA